VELEVKDENWKVMFKVVCALTKIITVLCDTKSKHKTHTQNSTQRQKNGQRTKKINKIKTPGM